MDSFPDPQRYETMQYHRCGRSGLMLPALALGLWHNFGGVDDFEQARAVLRQGFDLGITHFDLANNYGPPPGSAEETMGRVLKWDLASYRDELIISSKAGWAMWPGPYGDWGSRKYLVASLDQSLKRMGLEYVDIYYHHRPDPETPLAETMGALDHLVRSGKALYAGISSYGPDLTREAAHLMRDLGTPLVIHQPSYSMFNRGVEEGLLDVLADEGMGCIAFCPLAQGLLTSRYLQGIPADSRAAKAHGFLQADTITEDRLRVLHALNDIAARRDQTLAQLALAWVLRQPAVTTALIGASRPEQLQENVRCLRNATFSADDLAAIDQALAA